MKTPIRGAIAAALVATGPLLALAQTPPSAPARAASASTVKPTLYQSAFEGYRRFEDEKVQSWREANDNVGRIGGWQSYAREAAGQVTPQAPAASTPGHSKHKKP